MHCLRWAQHIFCISSIDWSRRKGAKKEATDLLHSFSCRYVYVFKLHKFIRTLVTQPGLSQFLMVPKSIFWISALEYVHIFWKLYTLVSRTPGDLIQYTLVSRTPGDLIQYNLVSRFFSVTSASDHSWTINIGTSDPRVQGNYWHSNSLSIVSIYFFHLNGWILITLRQ